MRTTKHQQQQESAGYLVVDEQDIPLLRMSVSSILRQKLFFRLALTAFFTMPGCIALNKRQCGILPYQGHWDVFATAVMYEEAREDAARRMVAAETDAPVKSMVASVFRPPSLPFLCHTTLFKGSMAPTHHISLVQDRQNLLLLDQDELYGLVQKAPELFTPEALWAARHMASFFSRTSGASEGLKD